MFIIRSNRMWFALALTCSLFNALQGAYGKRILDRIHPAVLTWAMFAYDLPIMALVLAIDGIPVIRPGFWPALAVTLTINLIAVTLYIQAIKLSPLSLTIPLLAFTPIFLVLTAFIVLGERPTALGLVGILFIVLGAYFLGMEGRFRHVLDPLRHLTRERGSLLMLTVALLWGGSAAADKAALLNSSPIFFVFAFYLLYTLLYLPILRWRAGPDVGQVTRRAPALFLFALLGGIMIISQMMAARMTLVSYVIAIKRAGMIFSIFLGYLFFGERHLGWRLGAAVLMVIGVCCLLLRVSP
jgi:drug/metabolite transporter (DMT)-like permease